MEKQSTGRVMMKLVVSVLALFLLMACGVFFGACKSEHVHNYKKSTSENMAATCGATGYEIYECEGCGDRYALSVRATGNHNFANGYCTVCGLPDVYDDAQLEKLLNDINAQVSDVKQSIDKIHVHNFSKEVFSVNATCYASGFVTRTCECGSSAITDPIDKLDHEWAAETITVPATCVAAGEVYRKCVNCETVVLYQTTAPTGHKYGTEMKTVVAATCTEPGYRGYQCEVCGEMGYSEAIPATDHRMVWSTKANTDGYAANCQHGDLTWYHCENENCPENWGEPAEVSAKGDHDYGFGDKYENQEVRPASCTEARIVKQVCRACGNVSDAEVTDLANPAKGHTWERTTKNDKGEDIPFDWSSVKSDDSHIVDGTYVAPLCNKVGGFVYKCEDCEETHAYVIPVDPSAHTVITEDGAPKKIDTISQLTGNLASMNGKPDSTGAVKNYHWNTVTYTHYLCENCREWLVKTAEVPVGGDPTQPNQKPSGEESKVDADAEYTVIERVDFDYETVDLDKDLKDWTDAGILTFSWHGWQDYDTTMKADADRNNGTVKNDYDEDVQIGEATCTTDGVHWYHCIDAGCTIVDTSVITPAIGHNYEIPNTLAQWEELLSSNVLEKEEEGDDNVGHDRKELTSSTEGSEGGTTVDVAKERSDIFYGADCTDYGVVFVHCINCFDATTKKYVKPEDVESEPEEENKYTGCTGGSEWAERIAITVRDGELIAVPLYKYLLLTESEGEGTNLKNYVCSDEELARRISNLDAFIEEYNDAHSASEKVEDYFEYVYDADINNNAIEKLYSAFEGKCLAGKLTPDKEQQPQEGKDPVLTEFKEKKYVFDPLGHVWEFEDKAEEEPADPTEEPWNVQKPPIAREDSELADWEKGLPEVTFDCTQPGYTGRWCSRDCCVFHPSSTEEEDEGEETPAPHVNDRHQKISLERGLEEENNEKAGDLDYAYDLNRKDKDGHEYYLVVKETMKSTETGEGDEKTTTPGKTFKGELTYEEINELFELLVEKEHDYGYRVDATTVKCGDEAPTHVYCKNEGCNVHFKDQVRPIEHIGNFGTYYTIGACGTAFGLDHSIIKYDYCLDCGKRVGLETVEKTDSKTDEVILDKDGNPVKEHVVDAKGGMNVVWTEDKINPMTGEPWDILPCELSAVETNYRHFPFNREMIDNLLKETTTDKDGNTVAAPNYKLYSAVWKMIDEWYETNNDELLRSSVLTGFLMTKSTTDKTNGWTARCYDCYTEFLSHKCANTEDTVQNNKKETHYFIVDGGRIIEFSGEDAQAKKDVIDYFVKKEVRKSLQEFYEGIFGPGVEIPESLVEFQALSARDNILQRLTTEANLNGYNYSSIKGQKDPFIEICLATHVRVDIYKAVGIKTCKNCNAYIWEKNEDGSIFTKVQVTHEKNTGAAGAGA